jgi:hypothetical protein
MKCWPTSVISHTMLPVFTGWAHPMGHPALGLCVGSAFPGHSDQSQSCCRLVRPSLELGGLSFPIKMLPWVGGERRMPGSHQQCPQQLHWDPAFFLHKHHPNLHICASVSRCPGKPQKPCEAWETKATCLREAVGSQTEWEAKGLGRTAAET